MMVTHCMNGRRMLVIPQKYLESIHVSAGDSVLLVLKGREILLTKYVEDPETEQKEYVQTIDPLFRVTLPTEMLEPMRAIKWGFWEIHPEDHCFIRLRPHVPRCMVCGRGYDLFLVTAENMDKRLFLCESCRIAISHKTPIRYKKSKSPDE